MKTFQLNRTDSNWQVYAIILNNSRFKLKVTQEDKKQDKGDNDKFIPIKHDEYLDKLNGKIKLWSLNVFWRKKVIQSWVSNILLVLEDVSYFKESVPNKEINLNNIKFQCVKCLSFINHTNK